MLREKGEPMPQEDVDNLLCEITIDGDNRIGIAEFVQHMIQTSS
jgi:Ca2+-binding EF-hand superfamily protein